MQYEACAFEVPDGQEGCVWGRCARGLQANMGNSDPVILQFTSPQPSRRLMLSWIPRLLARKTYKASAGWLHSSNGGRQELPSLQKLCAHSVHSYWNQDLEKELLAMKVSC